jgi:phosphoribosylformylglycinamidine cyclo-ligase
VDSEEMFRTFNMGIGMVLILGADEADEAIRYLAGIGEKAYPIGEVIPGKGEVILQ